MTAINESDSPPEDMKHGAAFFREGGVLALISGLILIASGVTSTSLLLTIVDYVDKYLGPHLPFIGNFVLNIMIATLVFVIGLGGLLVFIGGILLLLRHSFSGRSLIGLGGGMAIIGLLFSMGETYYVSGFASTIFHESYFTLYWVGAILATTSIVLSLSAKHYSMT
ncbi:MAG: hypothetical protein JRN15_21110 [Nitrososphaerota archaeon]|nr:hypothetical protein [Nitrososphaerota archaeon]